MAIALVQTAAAVTYITGLTGSISFTTQNVSAGNTIILLSYHFDIGGSSSSISFADGGNTYHKDVELQAGAGYLTVSLVSASNIAGGNKPTITATFSGGTPSNMRGALMAFEYSGIGSFDSGSTNYLYSGNTPTTGSTGALGNANDLIFAILGGNGNMAGITIPPTGGPGTYTDLGHYLTGGDATYYSFARQQIAGSSAPVSAAWGTASGVFFWETLVGTYKPTGAVTNSALLLASNQGGF